jgi:L-seryl-tRNA(Ser) seleniumtransferase
MNESLNRRSVVKWSAALPIPGTFVVDAVWENARAAVVWNERACNVSVADWDRELRNGEPRIEVLTDLNPSLVPAVKEGDPKASHERNKLQIVSITMQPGEEMIVGCRLRRILTNARAKRKV